MIVKLAKGTTTPVLLTITGIVRDVPSNNVKYGPQHKLVGHTPTDADACIFLAPDTAIRQLGRVGLTLDTAIGHTVAITRPGDYIDFASTVVGVPVPAPAAPAPTPPATPVEPDARLKAMFALYDKCFDHAAVTTKRLAAAGIPVTHEGVAAQAATLYIQASQRGVA